MQVIHYYQYTGVIMNLCEDEYDEESLLATYPETYIVHSKAPLFTQQERDLRKVFWEVLGRYPDKVTEQRTWLDAISASGTSRALLELREALCCSNEYYDRQLRHMQSEVCVSHCADDAGFRARCATKACSPGLERVSWQAALPDQQQSTSADYRHKRYYYVWTNDFHVGPAACYGSVRSQRHPGGISAAPRRHLGDISQVLAELGAQLHAEIDFNNCVWHPKMCRQRLKVTQGPPRPDLGGISAASRQHLVGARFRRMARLWTRPVPQHDPSRLLRCIQARPGPSPPPVHTQIASR